MREWLVGTLGGGAAALAILVAIIGLAGALGGAATSYFIGQQSIYVNAITVERMKWVALIRSNISEIITQSSYIVNLADDKHDMGVGAKDAVEQYRIFLKLREMIALQLNPFGLVDKNIIIILDALIHTFSGENKNYSATVRGILRWHSQWLFKIEWEKIKREAKSPIRRLFERNTVVTLQREYAEKLELEDQMSLIASLQDKKPTADDKESSAE